jgi:hypothetical protein
MLNESVVYKGFVICLVLFCAYMQWSPVVDLDYVWVNGHEHYVGAANPHQLGKAVVPILLEPARSDLQDSTPNLPLSPVEQITTPLTPAPTLRL